MRRLFAWLKYVVTPAPTAWRRRWQDRLFEGHITIGRVTIYGANAMHWAVNVWTRWGYVCFHPTTRTFGARRPWYLYVSPDATPSDATFKVGGVRFARKW